MTDAAPILRRWRGLRQDERGLALVEFACSLPVLLALCLCGLEVANLAIAHMRVSQVATLVADYAARERDTIDEADVNELLLGAKMAAGGLGLPEHGRVILSSLERNVAGNGQRIRWQRCTGAKEIDSSYGEEGAGETDDSLQGMGPAGNRIVAAPGQTVMVAEIFYDYQPLIGDDLLGRKTIRYVAAFNVRRRTDPTLNNAGGLPDAERALCNRYEA